MPDVPREYLGLMRDAVKDSNTSLPSGQRPLKRRKRNKRDVSAVSVESSEQQDNQGNSSDQAIVVETSGDDDSSKSKQSTDFSFSPVIDLSDYEDTSDNDNGCLEVRSGAATSTKMHDETIIVDDEEDGEDEEEDFDDDDFEDVDLNEVQPKASSIITGDVKFSVNKEEPNIKKQTRTKNVIDREERIFRKNFHRNYIAIMAIHGFLRNRWCNDKIINSHMVKFISTSIYDELHPSKSSGIAQIRTRRFLDGLRHLLERWSKYYKVTSNKGIYKHDWNDWYGYERSAVPFSRFAKCITKGRGSRDIGAQGFVALLRAANVPSRLVFSLQPPDFTSMAIKKKPEDVKPLQQGSGPRSVQEKLVQLRKGKVSTSIDRPTQAEIEMKYPVFWAEAWDSASRTWISIDPIQFKIIENIRAKSKLEPPSNYPHNQLTYVLGYDRKGGVRDITKRYAEKYYARTRKKRITKDESGEIWYTDFLESLSTTKRNRSDAYENEYFVKKATLEGMPDNIQDFKNHPFYVLETHLRANEILHPNEHCGMIRTKGKNNSIKVHRRENVQTLRTPRAWFQKGRVLKPGERAMLVRKKTPAQMRDDDDDPNERLYAIFQTTIYVPPPVKNGLITKNGYGNIDVYVPSMVPEGAVLISTPFATDAAKVIGVDYAPAVVGFKFERRSATPKIEGIVVAEEFKEAIETVQEQLKQEEIEKQRLELEIRALKGWALLLAKLRIKQRLNAHHGKVDEDDASDDEYGELEKEYEEYLENDESDDDVSDVSDVPEVQDYGSGGFIVEPNAQIFDDGSKSETYDLEESGGFMRGESVDNYSDTNEISNLNEPKDSGAGFLIEGEDSHSQELNDSDGELYHTAAGFIPDDKDEVGFNIDAGGFTPAETPEESYNEHENKDELIEMDGVDEMNEYEAFFDQLQKNDHASEDECDRENEPSKVTETIDLETETDGGLVDGPRVVTEEKSKITEPSQVEIPEPEIISEAVTDDGQTCETVDDINQENDIELQGTNQETNISLLDEQDDDLERQFKEQLRSEKEQNLSQSTQEGSQNEDYEFEYDSEYDSE